jgi:nitrogen regulatory protein P-II 1
VLIFRTVIRAPRASELCCILMEKPWIQDLSASEVLGSGRGDAYLTGNTKTGTDLLPRVIIEGLIEDEHKEELTGLIIAASRAGRSGDGKIFFQKVDVLET